MNGKELLKALAVLSEEKGLSEDELLSYTEAALNAAYKREYNATNSKVVIDKNTGDIKLYSKKSKSGYGFVSMNEITKNIEYLNYWKVVTSRSTSVPEEDNGQVLRMSQTFIAEPNSVVTESYVVIDAFKDKIEAENCMSYIKTKFLRFLCQPTIVSPDVSNRTFELVPLQDFSHPWTDEMLYKKYGLTEEEIAFIESMIRPME